MGIAENIKNIKQEIPADVKLVAVSKFHSVDHILEAYRQGQRIFGESRVQELEQKKDLLPNDIEWHFIGHLQTNKVKYIIPYIHTVHSVDSAKLFEEIERQADKTQKQIKCLLEVRIATEETKHGFSFTECADFVKKYCIKNNKYAYIAGIMGMATNTESEEQIREEFRRLKDFFEEIKAKYFNNNSNFTEISMGMSQDYRIAIEEGSTIVRLGSSIFGEREY